MIQCSEFLTRLDGLKAVGQDRWIARCPAHEDHDPSLSIKETASGMVLVHCFAGCGVGDIVTAVGLRVSDLMPDLPGKHRGLPIARRNLDRLFHFSRIEIIMRDVEVRHMPWTRDMIDALRDSRNWLKNHQQTEDWL